MLKIRNFAMNTLLEDSQLFLSYYVAWASECLDRGTSEYEVNHQV